MSVPAPAAAQLLSVPRRGNGIDVGVDASSVTLDGYAQAALGSVDATVWHGGERSAIAIDGTASRFETGHILVYAGARGDVDLITGPWHAALQADGGAGAFRGATSSGYGRLSLLGEHTFANSRRGWVLAGAGRAGAGATYPTVRAAAGGELASAEVAHMLTTIEAGVKAVHARSSYADATARLTVRVPDGNLGISLPLTIAVEGDVRRGGDAQHSPWVRGIAAMGFGAHAMLVASYGGFAPDPERALLGGRAATLGVRIRFGRIAPTRSVHPLVTTRSSPVRILPGRVPGERVIAIDVRNARDVEIMGDFTDWKPVAMSRADDGDWHAVVSVAPGVHHANLRIDAGPWLPLPGVPQVPDDFGGTSSVLVVQ